MTDPKRDVATFWNRASCGEDLLLETTDRAGYAEQARQRYALEPEILEFAPFALSRGKKVLEIGIGLGAEHQRFAEAGAVLHGIDLTERAISHTKARLAALGLSSTLALGDAENLPFADNTFDIVYAWGSLHHTPDTPRAFREVARVLRPGGIARIMIYSKWSVVGLMLWGRYALLRLRPWTSLAQIYAEHMESPGTKAYTTRQARELMAGLVNIEIRTVLTHGDLLESAVGQRHRGPILTIARKCWPRWFIRRALGKWGLYMLMSGTRPSA